MKNQLLLAACWSLFCIPATAEIENDFPLGIEAVTGFRSGYVHRGFDLADTSLEFQFAGEVTLSNERSLYFGLSHLAESSGDFSETAGYLELDRKISEQLRAGVSATYRDRNHSILESGLDLGLFTSFTINGSWEWRNELNYDFGAEGFYLASEITWSEALSDKVYLSISGGVSYLSDYENRSGLNDFFARISLNYAFSEQVAFSSFLGASAQLDSGEPAHDIIYGGLWFQVIF
ncbi:MAG: hypothetical protein QNL33_09065 [Akkermansiaceae bacterium]|jgi:hypothetical protein